MSQGVRKANACPNCGYERPVDCPPEPPVGTWVRDRHGGVSVRTVDSDGHDGWAPGPVGFYAAAKWVAMWEARGPLVECAPWGLDSGSEP